MVTLRRILREDEGVLTFEWILLITVLVIGVVGGLSAGRDALITELGDVSEAMISLDQSYTIQHPWDIQTPDCDQDGASDSSYTDAAGLSQSRLKPRDVAGGRPCKIDQCGISDCDPDIERPF